MSVHAHLAGGAWCAAVALLLVGCTTAQQRPPGQGGTILAALCAEIQNSYECAQAIERHQLQQDENSRRVERRAGALHFQLQDGQRLTVADSVPADESSVVRYSFRAYLSEIGYFLLHRQFYEGDEYVMLHDRSGGMFAIPNVPIISPDRTRLVTTFPGLSGGYSPNAVQIWQLIQDGLVKEYAIHPRDWEPIGARWVDDGTIRLETRTRPEGVAEMRTQTMELTVRDGRWILETSQAQTLCQKDERVIFGAVVNGSEDLLSICASRQLDDRRGYLQYRFGRPGRVEMEFPKDRRNSQAAFGYTRYTRPRVTYLTLRFETDGAQYLLHEDYDAERGPADVKAYLTRQTVTRPGSDPVETTIDLRVPVVGSLMDLESVVPNVP